MQKSKNINLLISLIILLVITTGVYWMSNRPISETIDKNIFKVNDLKRVDKVVLESKTNKITLKVTGNRWKINDKFEADRNLIDVLFATLQQAEPKRPVATALKDSLNKVLEAGIKVSLYKGELKEKDFYVGGNKTKTQAYFKETETSTPYIMVIPGYRVYTSGIFELDENGWRDKRIFNFNWRNFKSLEATFPNQPSQNFNATFIDQYFGIKEMPTADTTRLNTYLDAVSLLMADQFSGTDTTDTNLKNPPLMIIDVSDIADRHYKLSIYGPLNGEWITGKLGNGEMVLFKQRILSKIYKNRNYFIKGT